jgi:hypothetical protein
METSIQRKKLRFSRSVPTYDARNMKDSIAQHHASSMVVGFPFSAGAMTPFSQLIAEAMIQPCVDYQTLLRSLLIAATTYFFGSIVILLQAQLQLR